MRDLCTQTYERLSYQTDFKFLLFVLLLSFLPYVLICISTRRFRIILCVIYFILQGKFLSGVDGGPKWEGLYEGSRSTLNKLVLQFFLLMSSLSFLPYVLIRTSTTRYRKLLYVIYFIYQVKFICIGLNGP